MRASVGKTRSSSSSHSEREALWWRSIFGEIERQVAREKAALYAGLLQRDLRIVSDNS